MNANEKITQMLNLQQSLNDDTNGIGWENGINKNGKLISWKRCIYMECAELIDSFAWKHWKSINAPTNEDNLRVEVVDQEKVDEEALRAAGAFGVVRSGRVVQVVVGPAADDLAGEIAGRD